MALIRTSATVAAISGALGGVTFVNSRRGAVARHRPNSKPAQSEILTKQNAYFANVTRHWQAITEQNRLSWNAAAHTFQNTNRLGVQSSPNGFTLFTNYNLNHLRWLGSLRDAPPLETNPIIDISFDIDFEAAGPYDLDFTQPGHQSGSYIQLFGARNFSTNAPKHPAPFKQILLAALSPLGSFTHNVYDAWEETFGDMDTGESFSLRWRYWVLQKEFFPRAWLQGNGIVQP